MTFVYTVEPWWGPNDERAPQHSLHDPKPEAWQVRVYERTTRFGPEKLVLAVGPFKSRKQGKRWGRVDLPQHEPLIRLGWGSPPWLENTRMVQLNDPKKFPPLPTDGKRT